MTAKRGWTYDIAKALRFDGFSAAAAELTARSNSEWWLRNHTIEGDDQ
jgi:hypothetical protein